MAIRTVTYRVDDISGVESEDVDSFSVKVPFFDEDGDLVYRRISFDAEPANQKAFIDALNKGIARYLKLDNVQVKVVGSGSTDSVDQTHIREWAKENGYAVKDRGRIPADVMKAFNAANDTDVAANGDNDSE